MKKMFFGVIILSLFGVSLSACNSKNAQESKSSSSEIYEKKELSRSDIELIKVGNSSKTVYKKLGLPMKEWDTNFVYDELNNNVNKDKLMIDLLDGKDNEKLVPKYKKLSEHGESAKEIKNLKMLQYAFEDKTSTSTFLIWINPKTDKVVYLSERNYLDENGQHPEESSDDKTTEDTNSIDINNKTAAVGDTISFSNQQTNDSLEVTINSVTKSNGDDWHKPEGLYYAKVDFSVKNTGTKPFDVNAHMFEFYDSNNVKSNLDSWDYFSENIQAGKSANGSAYFDITNDGNSFEVFFADSSWKGSY